MTLSASNGSAAAGRDRPQPTHLNRLMRERADVCYQGITVIPANVAAGWELA